MFDTSQNDTDLVPELLFGLGKFIAEMGDTWAAKVLQLHPLQVVPGPLSRIQLRGIARQLLQVNPADGTMYRSIKTGRETNDLHSAN